MPPINILTLHGTSGVIFGVPAHQVLFFAKNPQDLSQTQVYLPGGLMLAVRESFGEIATLLDSVPAAAS